MCSSGGGAGGGTAGISIVAVAVGIPYSRVHFDVKIPLRPSSFDRFTSDSIALQDVLCELIRT